MATLITGGTGFVGANLVKDLASNGHTVAVSYTHLTLPTKA